MLAPLLRLPLSRLLLPSVLSGRRLGLGWSLGKQAAIQPERAHAEEE